MRDEREIETDLDPRAAAAAAAAAAALHIAKARAAREFFKPCCCCCCCCCCCPTRRCRRIFCWSPWRADMAAAAASECIAAAIALNASDNARARNTEDAAESSLITVF